jgi:hypothetical protein
VWESAPGTRRYAGCPFILQIDRPGTASNGEDAEMYATLYNFFARKTKIIVLTVLMYAALC